MRFENLHPADQLVQMMTRIYNQGLTTTSGGNVSIRDTNGDIYITPTSLDKGRLTKRDICRVLPSGEVQGGKPSVELPFHRHIYRVRPDISAIIHAHPPGLVGFSLARKAPRTDLFAGLHPTIGGVSIATYEVPGSLELGAYIAAEFEKGNDCIMMENHGVVVGKKDMLSAFMAFESLDILARVQFGAAGLGHIRGLSAAQLQSAPALATLKGASFPPPSSKERELRQELSYLCKRACTQSLFSASFGEFSARIDEESFLITPLGADRAALEPEDFVRVSSNTYALGQTPDTYVAFHLALYEKNEKAQAAAIARPAALMAYAVTDAAFDSKTIPESYLMLRFPARLPFGALGQTPGDTACLFNGRTPVALIENEGFIVAGLSPVNAYDRLEVGEYSARSLINCRSVGIPVQISDDEVLKIDEHFGLE